MPNNNYLIILLLVGLFFQACEKSDTDLSTPKMEIEELTPDPQASEICGAILDSVFVLTGGDQLKFEVIFRDDVALSQYKIDIHSNFDCHGHGPGAVPGVAVPQVDNLTADWAVLDIVDLSGTAQNISRTLEVPENITAGNYHFQIQVIDEAGNDNPLANFYSLKITNPTDIIAPELSVTMPEASSFEATKGTDLRFEGRVTDNYSLSEGGNGLLFLSFTDLSSGNTFNTDAVFSFDSSVSTTYDFGFDYTIPNTITAGDYIFSLRALDGVNNSSPLIEFEVAIKD